MNHYFDDNPISESKKVKITTTINNQNYSFISDNGVFSKNQLDYGTKLLLETLPIDNVDGKVLDLGCGYGPIGIYVAKNTTAEVHMVDINNRSLELAKINSIRNKVKAKIYKSDIYSNVEGTFDFIITNPPIRVGNAILYNFLFLAKKYLNKDGQLWLVIRKKQGAESVLKKLREKYKVEIVNKSKGYYIIKAIIVD